MIKYYNCCLLIIISVLILNVQSQLSASNQKIILKEFSILSPNQYSSYPSLDQKQCLIITNYLISNLKTPKVIGATLDKGYIAIQSLLLAGNNSTTTFIIEDELDSSFSTSFEVKHQCYEIDTDSLQISLLDNKFLNNLINLNTFLLFTRIKGLLYPLEKIIILSPNPNLFLNSYKVSNEYFQITATILNFDQHLTNEIQFNISFPNRNFTFTVDPLYSNSSYQTIRYQTFPNYLTSFTQIGNNINPLVTFTSIISNGDIPYYKTVGNSSMSIPIRIGQVDIGGILRYIYIFDLANKLQTVNYNYNLIYNNGPSSNSINLPVTNYKKYNASQLSLGIFQPIKSLFFSFSFNSSGYIFNHFKYTHSYGFSSISEAPYGFSSGNNLNFTYKSYYRGKASTSISGMNTFSIYEYPLGKTTNVYFNPYSSENVADTTPPEIVFFELIHLEGLKFFLRIKVKDEGTVFLSYGTKNKITIGIDKIYFSIVPNVYIFESQIKLDGFFVLEISDYYSNTLKVEKGSFLYIEEDGTPVFFNFKIPYYDLDIQNVTFLENDIDVLNREFFNIVYFNSSTLPIDYPLEFTIYDDVSKNLGKGTFPVKYDNDKKLFYSRFLIPKNTNDGIIGYGFNSLYVSNNFLLTGSNLRISKTNFDNEGPIISSIINANTFGKVGWRITITDQVNGFSNGYVKVVGSLDSSIFKFNFTISDAVQNSGSTIWRGNYDIILNITSTRCVSQDYKIDYIYLEDTNRLYSYFTKFDNDYPPVKNPLRNHLDNLEYYLKSSSKCPEAIQDTTPPELVSFKVQFPPNNDAGSKDRRISFNFTARDLESGLLSSQSPIVYIHENFKNTRIECESTIISINNTHAEYYCELELPLGYCSSLTEGYMLSVYGFINNGALYSGFGPDHPLLSDYMFPLNYIFDYLLTGYEPYYYSDENLILYGRLLGVSSNVSIVYSDGTNKWYTPIKILGESVLIIKRNDYPTIYPFNVTVNINNRNYTNSIIVYPIYYNNSVKPEIPIPTNKPQQCLGNPICGGPSKGYCDKESGCVCYSPWIGKDCLSQVIIVPQPNVNQTSPTTEIPSNNNSSSGEIDESEIFYSSLISIVSLRELSLNNSIVHEHSLDRWVLNQIDQYTSQYFTNITFKSKSNYDVKFEIYATLKWFINDTIFQFADQDLKMNPSSMKYTIDIFNYPFESGLNRLQLVMHASFLSNKTNDICSSKEFGDTTSGDNSNYIKIQVNNKSLYGRFIKRGVIDDRIVSLSNELLDQEMNAINNPNQVQSYIGISIPWFERQSTIDPDFSVLIDSSSTLSNCALNNISKLSSTKIVGIVIGSVVFVTAIVVAAVYSIYKSKQKKRFFKTVGIKLNIFKQEQQTNTQPNS